MAKRSYAAGSRSQTVDIFIEDSSSSVGAGLTGLTSGSAGLTCYYRKGATGTPTSISLTSQTIGGAWVSGGFVAADGTNTPGQYRLDLPDTLFAAPGSVIVHLKGATNMKPVVMELEIVGDATYNAVTFSVVAHTTKGSSTGITVTTNAVTTTGADFILASINSLSAYAAPTMYDTYNNRWEQVLTSTANWARLTIYKCVAPRTGTNHTFTCGNGESPSMEIIAVSGARLANLIDLTSTPTNNQSTSIQPASVTPTENNEIILQCLCASSSAATTPSINLGYTAQGQYGNSGGGNHIGGSLAYLVQTTAAASQPTWTTGNNWNIAVAITLRPRIAGDYVEIDQFAEGRIYPLDYVFGGGVADYADVPITGIYWGATPIAIDMEVVDWTTGNILQGYTQVNALSTTSTTWSGTLRIPKSTNWIKLRARSRSLTKTLAESTRTSFQFGVGYLFALGGQSNGYHWFDNYGSPPAANSKTKMHTFTSGWATGWQDVTGNGARVYADKLQVALNCLVGVMHYNVSGSGLHAAQVSGYWMDLTAGQPYDKLLTGIAAVGGRIHGFLWNQGECDAELAVSQANYQTDMATLYSRILTYCSATYKQLWFGTAILGPLLVGTDASVSDIRYAQMYAADHNDGMFIAYSQIDGVLADNYHYLSATWYERFAKRGAQSTLYHMGLVSAPARGPEQFRSFRSVDSPTIRIQVAGLGNDGLVEPDGTTDGGQLSPLTGFEVTNDDFATTLTIVATSFEDRFINLILQAAPTGTVKYRFAYQQDVGVTRLPLRNLLPQGDTIGVPLLPIAATTVPIMADPDVGEVATKGTLPIKHPIDVGYTIIGRDGLTVQARDTENVVIIDENDDEVTYGVSYVAPDVSVGFTGGFVVIDNTEDSVAEQLFTSDSGSTNIDPSLVDDEHTFRFSRPDQLVADAVIREIVGFNALIAMDFSTPLHPKDSVSSALITVINPATGLAIADSSNLPISTDGTTVLMYTNITVAGTYLIVVEATTADSQNLLRRGVVVAESPTGT